MRKAGNVMRPSVDTMAAVYEDTVPQGVRRKWRTVRGKRKEGQKRFCR